MKVISIYIWIAVALLLSQMASAQTAEESFNPDHAILLRLDSIDLLTQEIHKNPKDHGLYERRANSKLWLEDYQGTILDCDKAIKLQPTAAAYYTRGFARQKLGDFKSATLDYSRAIELNPSHKE